MIDFYQEKLPVIDKFILPSGHPVAGHFHLARTVTRRAEREITELILEETETNQMSYKLINRLSDLFLSWHVMSMWFIILKNHSMSELGKYSINYYQTLLFELKSNCLRIISIMFKVIT